MEGVDNGGGYAYVGAGNICELAVVSALFYYEVKTALKNKIHLRREKKSHICRMLTYQGKVTDD